MKKTSLEKNIRKLRQKFCAYIEMYKYRTAKIHQILQRIGGKRF